jgi:hypothetical protein
MPELIPAPPQASERAAGVPAARVAGRLDSYTDNLSPLPPISAHDGRWERLEFLRNSSSLSRQRRCATRPLGPTVALLVGPASASFGQVRMCGSRTCPVCAPNLYAGNRREIEQSVEAWRAYGGDILFGTFTIRHTRDQTFADLRAAVGECWSAVTSGKGWVGDRRRHGVAHWVRVFEEKWNERTGWHLHIHYLMFVEPGFSAMVPDLLKSMFRRWSGRALKLGLVVPLLRGQDLKALKGDEAQTLIADYLTKQGQEGGGHSDAVKRRLEANLAGVVQRSAARAVALKSSSKIALELTLRDGKFSSDSLTPGELLTLAMIEGGSWLVVWKEYELGMLGRQVIGWSNGLRAFAGIFDPVPDAVAAQFGLVAADFRQVVSMSARRSLLERLFRSPAGAFEWLAGFGIFPVNSAAVPVGADGWALDEYSGAAALDMLCALPY